MIVEILILLVCIVGATVTLRIIKRWDNILDLTDSLRRKRWQNNIK